MHRATGLNITELNPHLICVLCGGYLIDATTIVECLHSFCKTCIVRYLESSKFCPICDVQVHKTKPLMNIRLDHTLQDIVYKLVPGLFQDEIKRRRKFYEEEMKENNTDDKSITHSTLGAYLDDDGQIQRERVIYSEDEQISVALELSTDGKPPNSSDKSSTNNSKEVVDRRYLQCPAAVTIGHLKKFIRMKYNLCDRYQIDVYHTDETLKDEYTLIDVAYIYFWRRKGPLKLFYTVSTNPAKRLKTKASCTVTKNCGSNDSAEIAKTVADFQTNCSTETGTTNPLSKTSCKTQCTLTATVAKSSSICPENESISPKVSSSSTQVDDKVEHSSDRSACGSADSWSSRPLNGSCDFSNHYDSEVPQDLSINKNRPIERRHSFGYCKEKERIERQHKQGYVKEKEKTDKPKPNGYLPNGEVDKFAFTDEDELPITSPKLHHIKSEPATD